MSIKEYMPWMAIECNGYHMVVRDSFCSPYGPRLWHRFKMGVPEKFIDPHDAWEVAHRLNKEVYWGEKNFKKKRDELDSNFHGKKILPDEPRC